MATAQDLINSAAKFAGILAEGQALESGINNDCLNRLNRMIARWKNGGVDLNINTLALNDTVYVDEADEECIEINLALRLMARHRRQIDPAVSASATTMFIELQAKYTTVEEMDLDLHLYNRNDFFDITQG